MDEISGCGEGGAVGGGLDGDRSFVAGDAVFCGGWVITCVWARGEGGRWGRAPVYEGAGAVFFAAVGAFALDDLFVCGGDRGDRRAASYLLAAAFCGGAAE